MNLFQHTEVLLIFRSPHSSILMFYWFSYNLITAYWGIVDSNGTSFHHTNMLLILIYGTAFQHKLFILIYGTAFQHKLLIIMWPHSSILRCYCFSCDLIPAYWCVIDSHVTSFLHTDVLLIPMWPHSSILKYYWFSCDLILGYRSIVDSQLPLF